MATTTDPAIEALTFDDALAELQRTVAELEAGGLPLEAAIARYERGVALQAAASDSSATPSCGSSSSSPGPAADSRRATSPPEDATEDLTALAGPAGGSAGGDVQVEPEAVARVVAGLDLRQAREVLAAEGQPDPFGRLVDRRRSWRSRRPVSEPSPRRSAASRPSRPRVVVRRVLPDREGARVPRRGPQPERRAALGFAPGRAADRLEQDERHGPPGRAPSRRRRRR